ncbi:hypothetical protein [Bordetella sp. 2513F-2]
MASSSDPPRTLFVYTEEQRGNQLVESVLVGMISDIAGAEKLVVVKDPHSGIQFVYRVLHEISNLDAAAITELDPAEFDGRRTTQINGMNYRLGTPDSALRLLRGKTHWVQDKGCVLSVLLQNAAARRSTLVSRSIARERLTRVPPGVPVEYLADRTAAQAESAPDTTTPA